MHKETKKAPEVPGLRVLDSPLDRSDFYPKAQISKRLSKKNRSLSKKRHSRRTPLQASDGQTFCPKIAC